MTEARQSIPVDHIHVPEDYVRPLDETAAMALARLMDAEGQKTPIAVYRSPARARGQKPYTLVYGARRLWAAKYLGWVEVDAILRAKDETDMVALADNLSTPSLDALEQAEHLTEYRDRWETHFGAVRRGGDKKSKRQNVGLIEISDFSEKSNFYKDIDRYFGINERRAQRLFKIGRLHPSLRGVVRGTAYAKDYSQLARLTKLRTLEQQVNVAAEFAANPDLDAVLRKSAPAAGREGVGRMETGDWREKRFLDAWDAMPKDRLAAVLERRGAMFKPVQQWPEPPPVRGIQAPGNTSPLWGMMKDPYATLYVAPTVAEIEAAKRQHAQEESRAAWLASSEIFEKINANEQAQRAAHEQKVKKAKAAKSRKPKRGRPADPPHVKREKAFRKWFIPDLATNLLVREEVGLTHWAPKYCQKLDAKEQFWVACHLGNGHSVDDIPWRVERSREDEAREVSQNEN